MKVLTALASASALTLAAISLAAPTQAAVIAQFTPDTAANDYGWARSVGGTGGELTSLGSNGPLVGCTTCAATHFSFLAPSLAALAFLPATFQIDAVAAEGHPASVNEVGVFSQPGLDGNFHFTFFDPSKAVGDSVMIAGHTLVNGVTDLLSGAFTGAWIQGAGGSGSTNLAIANGGHLTLASDVLDFSSIDATTEEFALNLLGVSPTFGAGTNKSLDSFKANGGGNFSADFVGVPEPATWGLLIVGFGGLGALARRRRQPALAR